MIDQKSNNEVLAQPPRPSKHSPRIRIRFVLISVLTPAVLLLLLLPFGLGFGTLWATTRQGCIDDHRTPAQLGLAFQNVNVPARWGGSYPGFFIPGMQSASIYGATILIPPTGPGSSGTTLDYASILAAHGYSVLTWSSRACVNRSISLGYREIDDVEDAFDYLRRNPDKLPLSLDHIGLFGVSTAGATVTMAAARNPIYGAIVAVGNYSNLSDMAPTTDPHDVVSALVGLGARFGYWLSTGEDAANLNPLGVISHVAPRPVLLIYGSQEESLPGAKRQLAALMAADPAESASLWIVPGADHGGYFEAVGGDEFARHLLPFFDCALLRQSCGTASATF